MAPTTTDAPTDAPTAPAEPACREVAAFSQRCALHLKERERELAGVEDVRVAREGTPIAKRAVAVAPRFEQPALVAAMQQAFVASRVPGAVEGVDCTEYPCILFGRIRGGEDLIEQVNSRRRSTSTTTTS